MNSRAAWVGARRWVPFVLPLAACEPGVLDPVGPVGAGDRSILLNALVIMLVIVVPVIVATLVFAWWYREGNPRARYRPDWSFSGQLELLVWSVPLLVVVFLAGIGWIGSHQLEPSRPLAGRTRPVTIQVIALDWKWLFIYPEQGVASVNHVVLPVGVPIDFRITSATVMNSFFIPRLGSQIYAMSGMEAKLMLQADRSGRYRGLSAHYSGAGFADMTFAADAVPAAEFGRWIAGARGRGNLLDARSYLALAKNKSDLPPFTYAAVSPGLFRAAVRQSGAPVHEVAHDGREEP